MSIQIKLKNSVVQDSTPSTSDLPAVGEIALNANINSIGGFMRASNNTIVKIFGPGSLSTPTATTTVSGISELATNAETITGTATNRVVTPAGLNAVTVAERTTSNTNYVAKAGSTLTGVLTMPNGSNSAPAINFGDSDSGIFGGTNTVSLAAGGTTRLTADTGVSVVGTLAVTGAITSTSDLTIADKIIHSGDTNTAIRFPAADTVSVETGGSEAIRVDSSQRLLVGTSSSRSIGGNTQKIFQIEGTDAQSGISITRNSATNTASMLSFGKSRGTSNGTSTIVNDNDQLGRINFAGADGTDTVTEAAKIEAFVDGAPGANDMPGRLVFSTTADGADASTERLRIDSSGRLLLGTTTEGAANADEFTIGTSASTGMTIRSGSSDAGSLFFSDATSGTGEYAGYLQYDHATNYLAIGTNATERMRIDSSGRLLLGTTTEGHANSDDLTIAGSGDTGITIRSGTSSAGQIFFSDATSGNAEFAGFIQYLHNQNSLNFGTDESTRMTINNSGSVGIGTTSPSELLQVAGTLECNNIKFLTANKFETSPNVLEGKGVNGARLRSALSAASTPSFSNSDDPDSGLFLPGSNVLGLSTGGSERLRIDASGRVLIGATTEGNESADELTINSSGNTGITLRSGTSANTSLFFSDATSGAAEYAGFIQYQHATDDLKIGTSSNTRFTINSSGKVMIGTTTEGFATFGDDLTLASSDHTGITIRSGTTHRGSIYFSDGNSGDAEYQGYIQYNHDDGRLVFGTTATERIRIDASGRVLAGSTTTANNGRIQGFIAHGSTAGESGITSVDTTSMAAGVGGEIAFYGKTSSSGYNYLGHVRGIKENGTDSNTACALTFHTRPTLTAPQERMRIDSDGDLLVGLTTALSTQAGSIQAAGPLISKSYINAHTSNAAILQYISNKAVLRAYGATSGSGILQFNVGGGGDATDFEAMRITNDGKVGIGTSSPAALKLHLYDATNTSSSREQFRISGGDRTSDSFETGIRFHTVSPSANGNRHYRLTANGNIGLTIQGHETSTGNAAADRAILLNPSGGAARFGASAAIQSERFTFFRQESDGNTLAYFHQGASADVSGIIMRHGRALSGFNGKMISFVRNDATEVGSIVLGVSSTGFNTSSDYRLKENVTPISDGITRLKTLKPYRFNFKDDTTKPIVDGFFAHEVTAVPEAITGTKDEVDADNNPVYQSIDHSKLVPLLVAAVQELIGKVEKLEAA